MMETTMNSQQPTSLDAARDAFEENPCQQTAAWYRNVAREYHNDEMISDATLEAILLDTAA
jgi:hypothetical protein